MPTRSVTVTVSVPIERRPQHVAPESTPASNAHIPRTVGRFSVLEVIGRGGEGTVYLGHDPQLDRPVAIKRLHRTEPRSADNGQSSLLSRQAQIHALLNHANIVQVYELARDEEAEYIINEYVEGQTLAHVLRPPQPPRQPLTMLRKLELAMQVAAGLRHAHERGVLHRDLKSSNILIDKDGAAKITDFGIAMMCGHGAPNVGQPLHLLSSGTPYAMAPEQTLGMPSDERSDIFSLGLLYYELFAGTRAFEGASDQGVAAKIRHAVQIPASEVNASVPPDLSRLIDRMLSKSPADRPASVAVVSAALAELLEHQRSQEAERAGATRDATFALVSIIDCACDLPSEAQAPQSAEHALSVQLELEALAAGVAHRLEATIVATYAGHVVACIGYPQAHDQPAHAALRFADELERKLAACCEASGLTPLSLRCGISVGRVLVQGRERRRAWAGLPFERAATLRDSARPGQRVIDAGAQAQLQAVIDTQPLGRMHGRGPGQAYAAFAVLSALPEATTPGSATHPYLVKPLLGRQSVAKAVQVALLDAVGCGRVQLHGPPGIGKTHLIRSVLSSTLLDGWRKVVIEGVQSRQYQAFGAVASLLMQLMSLPLGADGALRDQRFRERLAALDLPQTLLTSPLWGVLIGTDVGTHAQARTTEDRHEDVVNAAVALLSRLIARRSLLLVVEDAQWLDHSSRKTLTRLCQGLPSDQLKVLLTSRGGGTVIDVPATAIELKPLPDEDAQDLLDELFRDRPISAHQRQRILLEAEGVPLLLELLAKHGDSAAEPALSSLEAAVAARLRELGEARRVAEYAAVLGRTISVDLLRASLDMSADAIHSALRALQHAGLLLHCDETWAFSHGMVSDLICQTIPAERRRRLHAAIVAAATSQSTPTGLWPAAALARHCSESGDFNEAARHYREGALAAMEPGAYFEARCLLEAGLAALAQATPCDDALKHERELRQLYSQCLVTSEGWSSDAKRNNNERLQALNRRLGSPLTAADCMGRFTDAMFSGLADSARAAICQLQELPADDEVQFVSNTARGYLAFFTGHWDEAMACCTAAIALRERLDPARCATVGIAGCGLELLGVPDLQAAAIELARDRPACVQHYVSTAPGLHHPHSVVALTFLGYGVTHALITSHQPDGAARLMTAANALNQLAAAQKNALYNTFAEFGLGYAQTLTDSPGAGLKWMRRSHESMDAMSIRGGLRLFYDCYYIEALLSAGQLDAARALVDERWGVAREELASYCRPDYLLLAARVRFQSAHDGPSRDAALSLLDDALVAAEALTKRDSSGLGARLVLAKIERGWAELTRQPVNLTSVKIPRDGETLGRQPDTEKSAASAIDNVGRVRHGPAEVRTASIDVDR